MISLTSYLAQMSAIFAWPPSTFIPWIRVPIFARSSSMNPTCSIPREKFSAISLAIICPAAPAPTIRTRRSVTCLLLPSDSLPIRMRYRAPRTSAIVFNQSSR